MTIKKVGIIGAGTMGNGIAQACAVVGIPSVMLDINDAAVQKGVATISGSLDRLVKKEKMTAEQKAAAMALVKPTTSMADFGDVDIVIEAATENLGLKQKLLKDDRGRRLAPRLHHRQQHLVDLHHQLAAIDRRSRQASSACTSSIRCR
jgi:3-hydroxybutyryl-CoA dehydrogenase